MKLYFIRHAVTEGNKRKAYTGAGTDEPVCAEGIAQLEAGRYPKADIVFVSPMKRCIMTAEHLYPGQEKIVCEAFREMDFGSFEGKTYEELKDNPVYIKWIESGGEAPFPNGEAKKAFAERSRAAFLDCLEQIRQSEKTIETAVFVVHGGTIMAIMEEYGTPKGDYYRWQVKNGEFIELDIKLEKIKEFSENKLKKQGQEADIICVGNNTRDKPAPK